MVIARLKRVEMERIRVLHQKTANFIGKAWTRRRERHALLARFELRRLTILVQRGLEAERKLAEEKRDEAQDELRAAEESLQATIAASWNQGSDETGKNYYYNYVTGESRWDPPENWNIKLTDKWVRNVDDRGQVYYYNQMINESRWLPPCAICSMISDRWCAECGVGYCVEHFDDEHTSAEMSKHTWSVAESEKEKLNRGEVYCNECKKRACSRVCTVCWDYYCDKCFKYVHHSGDLRMHPFISYQKAKKGWVCVKPKDAEDKEYYVNGTHNHT